MDYNELALELHKQHKGKITTSLRDKSELTKEKLSAYYTPGVAAVSRAIADNPSLLPEYTWTNNLVAVISDGSAVLGLGNIGPQGSMPETIIATIKAIAPSFGAINLEDIAAPQCFEIEERLKAELNIPVFHDDQHGTAVVVLAGLINAMKVVGKRLEDTKIVIVGAGAAGTAITKLLHLYAQPRIIAVDSKGIINSQRSDLNEQKKMLLEYIDTDALGSLEDAMSDADIFIGVSQPGLLTAELITKMADQPVIFALANPTPEVMPDVAKAAGAAVIATGRSDFPNQVNNATAFPGIFRGALDNKVQQITDNHKIAAAEIIASLVDEPTADCIIPSVFDKRLVPAIAQVITKNK